MTPLVLVWLRLRRPSLYTPLRNVLVLVSLVALLSYWLLPLAPPRLAIPGIVDTLKVNDILSAGEPKGPASLANQYAAMPSLHVAWAVWVALARRRRVAADENERAGLALPGGLDAGRAGHRQPLPHGRRRRRGAGGGGCVGHGNFAYPSLPALVDLREPAAGGPARFPVRRTDD